MGEANMSMVSKVQPGKIEYLKWAATRCIGADKKCPGCGGNAAKLIRRKYLVTGLYECAVCRLRFRVPKESTERSENYYVEEIYQQGFTTTLPSADELRGLRESRFAGTEKDFGEYIRVLRSLLPSGARILDFGSSWGYGSWQMTEAGFDVFSYEIGRQRAQYAHEQLGCTMVEDLRSLDGTIDCFFSAHVIEHLPDPNVLFREAASLLRRGGVFVCFCPNGNPDREREDTTYHQIWGEVHPLYITPDFMRWACAKHGLASVEVRAGDKLVGPELLTVAHEK
jgi:2-polyprenyl-3-methyl-5-hydroxy-6-metoxy-1,4-benzoquinol methylase